MVEMRLVEALSTPPAITTPDINHIVIRATVPNTGWDVNITNKFHTQCKCSPVQSSGYLSPRLGHAKQRQVMRPVEVVVCNRVVNEGYGMDRRVSLRLIQTITWRFSKEA